MGFAAHYLQHFSYRQALDPNFGPTGSYCPLTDPGFGH